MKDTIIIESLFPEACNLFGDISNISYLKKCLPNATFIDTSFHDELYCISHNVNMIYMGPMTEKMQEKAIEKLKPYKDKLKELIEKNIVFLITGNSLEIFEDYIENEDGSRIEGLGIFHLFAKRDMMHRHNSIFMGKYNDIEIVGFKSQFTFSYGENDNYYFSKAEKGIGINPTTMLEGINKNNFFGTYVIGPILILNPYFTKKILEKIGVDSSNIAFEEEVIKAYEQRICEFKALK